MKSNQPEYSPPKAMRLDSGEVGRGDCMAPGSSDIYLCYDSGSTAGDDCYQDGIAAGYACMNGMIVH